MSELRLTAVQRRWLQAALKTPPTPGSYRRAAALLALDEGQSVGEVAELLGVSRQSVYNWSQAFAQSPRPETLYDDFGGGRPTLWTEKAQALLSECFRLRPEELGYAGMNWTVPLLRECLLDRTGLRLSDDTIRRQLQRLGYVWKRFRYVLPADPQREKKKRHSPAFAGLAATQRQAGGGRNRPAVVSAAPRRLGVARATGSGAYQRRKRQAGSVRRHQSGDGPSAAAGA
jgi:transposase